MSSIGSAERLRDGRATRLDYGVFGRDKFWRQILSGHTAPAEPDSLFTRVEPAWHFMRTMFYTPGEHAALVETVVRVCQSRD